MYPESGSMRNGRSSVQNGSPDPKPEPEPASSPVTKNCSPALPLKPSSMSLAIARTRLNDTSASSGRMNVFLPMHSGALSLMSVTSMVRVKLEICMTSSAAAGSLIARIVKM